MKHTPGPWRTESSRNGYEVWGNISPTGSMRIAVTGHAATFDKAGAQLIAVAPEMMSALKRAYHVFAGDTDRKRELLNTIGEIIAKAEGRQDQDVP